MSLKNYVFAIVLGVALCVSAAAQALTVQSMRAGVHPDKTRIVIDLSAPTKFTAYTAGDRLVIDLPKGQVRAKSDGDFTRAGLTNFKTTAQKNGKTRLSFDLKKSLKHDKSFLMPRKGNSPPRIVIDLVSTDAVAPARGQLASQSGVLGQLVFRAPGQQAHAASMHKTPPQTKAAEPEEQVEQVAMQAPEPDPVPAMRRGGAKKRVVLDAGHGGKDTGAIGVRGVREKDITLAIARELKKQLEATGRYTVKLTRDKDIFITLPGRVKMARQHKADLFISLHADSIDHSNDRRTLINGASIYTLSEKASDAQTAKLAERENMVDVLAGVNLGGESKEVADILLDLAMRETMNQSKYFANTIVEKFDMTGITLLERPHRYAGFAVLKAPDVPSVLIELGFMSSPREEKLLSTDAHRRKISGAIRGGVDRYFDKLESAQRN